MTAITPERSLLVAAESLRVGDSIQLSNKWHRVTVAARGHLLPLAALRGPATSNRAVEYIVIGHGGGASLQIMPLGTLVNTRVGAE